MKLEQFGGHGAPLTQRGLGSPYGPLPWHMAGRNLTVWFRVPSDEIARHVPEPLTVPRPSDELHFFVPFELVQAEHVPFLDLTMPYGKILVELQLLVYL
jgi:hypothetical protein